MVTTLLSSSLSSTSTASSLAAANQAIAEGKVKAAQAAAELSDISDSVAAIQEKSKKQATLSEAQAKITVETLEKQVNKSAYSTTSSATDIGTLVANSTRLNVYSNLKKGDQGDVYRFKAQGSGNITLGVVSDPGLRIQVTTRYGGIIADSKEGTGKSNQSYKALQQGDLKLAGGEYFIKVTHESNYTRDESGKLIEDKNYALQLSMGLYKTDYDTIAQQATSTSSTPQLSSAQLELQSMLQTQAYSATGETGSQKLTTSLFGG